MTSRRNPALHEEGRGSSAVRICQIRASYTGSDTAGQDLDRVKVVAVDAAGQVGRRRGVDDLDEVHRRQGAEVDGSRAVHGADQRPRLTVERAVHGRAVGGARRAVGGVEDPEVRGRAVVVVDGVLELVDELATEA